MSTYAITYKVEFFFTFFSREVEEEQYIEAQYNEGKLYARNNWVCALKKYELFLLNLLHYTHKRKEHFIKAVNFCFLNDLYSAE